MSFGSLSVRGQTLSFDTPYSADFVAAVKQIPGRKWDSDRKSWSVPVSESALAIKLAEKYDVRHDQAEDRAHRIGQKNAVNCWYIHAPETIDDAMAAIIEEKREIARQVMGDKAIDNGKQVGDVKKILASIEGRASEQGKLDIGGAPEKKPRKATQRHVEAELER